MLFDNAACEILNLIKNIGMKLLHDSTNKLKMHIQT